MAHGTAREEHVNTAPYIQSISLVRAISTMLFRNGVSHDHVSLFAGNHGMSSLATEDSRELASFPRPDQRLHFPWHCELPLTAAQPRLQRPPPTNASSQYSRTKQPHQQPSTRHPSHDPNHPKPPKSAVVATIRNGHLDNEKKQ